MSGEGRGGLGGRGAEDGWDVGDDEDLRHLRMDHVRGHVGGAVVLDLRAEEAGEADQEGGVLGHRAHAGQDHQAVAAGKCLGEGGGVGFGGIDDLARALGAFDVDAAAEGGAGEGVFEAEADVHGALLRWGEASDGADAASNAVWLRRGAFGFRVGPAGRGAWPMGRG
jgi:hypothetical protein